MKVRIGRFDEKVKKEGLESGHRAFLWAQGSEEKRGRRFPVSRR